jgi:Phage tail protein
MQLNADVSIGSLILNTVDENGVVWVCTDIEGWWVHPEPEVRDIPRGWGDGSYDVRGRYQARQITLNGVFLTPDPSLIPVSRDKLIQETDLVYVGGWLKTNENPTKASFVRLSGQPDIQTVNARGRTEFSIGLRAPDPLKYEWYEGHELGYRAVTIAGEDSGTVGSGTGTVTNTGNAYSPVVFEVTGPVVGPATILNETTNESITIIGALRGVLTPTVSNRALTGNIATLTTSAAHGLLAGDVVVVSGVHATFNGTFTILTVPTTTTLTYAKTAGNVGSVASSGTVTSSADILEVDTRDHEVALNGDVVGKRSLIDVLAEWTLLAPGANVFSFYDEGDLTSAASLTVYYRSAWLG